jgi:hypothetical protein
MESIQDIHEVSGGIMSCNAKIEVGSLILALACQEECLGNSVIISPARVVHVLELVTRELAQLSHRVHVSVVLTRHLGLIIRVTVTEELDMGIRVTG